MAWPPPPTPQPPKQPKPGALIDAVVNGDTIAVRRLLQENADPNERDASGNTALHRAATYGSIEIVRLLIDNKANLDSRNKQGDTPLMVLIPPSYSTNRDTIVRLLLDRGASMDIKNNNGDTAMSLAVQRSRTQIVSMLKDTTRSRKLLAEEFARAAEAQRKAEVAAKQDRLRNIAHSRPKPGPGPKPPKAA